ncbi:hypothetical protein [Viridibacillus arvi]|uniref:hypothetical protein n=1 Tax=Viridibacillus arvi TaxID=263475 RepID=UPI0034CDFFB8
MGCEEMTVFYNLNESNFDEIQEILTNEVKTADFNATIKKDTTILDSSTIESSKDTSVQKQLKRMVDNFDSTISFEICSSKSKNRTILMFFKNRHSQNYTYKKHFLTDDFLNKNAEKITNVLLPIGLLSFPLLVVSGGAKGLLTARRKLEFSSPISKVERHLKKYKL